MHNPTCLTELYNSCLNSCSKATLLEVANGVNDQILMVRQFAFFVQQLVPLPIYSNPFSLEYDFRDIRSVCFFT